MLSTDFVPVFFVFFYVHACITGSQSTSCLVQSQSSVVSKQHIHLKDPPTFLLLSESSIPRQPADVKQTAWRGGRERRQQLVSVAPFLWRLWCCDRGAGQTPAPRNRWVSVSFSKQCWSTLIEVWNVVSTLDDHLNPDAHELVPRIHHFWWGV